MTSIRLGDLISFGCPKHHPSKAKELVPQRTERLVTFLPKWVDGDGTKRVSWFTNDMSFSDFGGFSSLVKYIYIIYIYIWSHCLSFIISCSFNWIMLKLNVARTYFNQLQRFSGYSLVPGEFWIFFIVWDGITTPRCCSFPSVEVSVRCQVVPFYFLSRSIVVTVKQSETSSWDGWDRPTQIVLNHPGGYWNWKGWKSNKKGCFVDRWFEYFTFTGHVTRFQDFIFRQIFPDLWPEVEVMQAASPPCWRQAIGSGLWHYCRKPRL